MSGTVSDSCGASHTAWHIRKTQNTLLGLNRIQFPRGLEPGLSPCDNGHIFFFFLLPSFPRVHAFTLPIITSLLPLHPQSRRQTSLLAPRTCPSLDLTFPCWEVSLSLLKPRSGQGRPVLTQVGVRSVFFVSGTQSPVCEHRARFWARSHAGQEAAVGGVGRVSKPPLAGWRAGCRGSRASKSPPPTA